MELRTQEGTELAVSAVLSVPIHTSVSSSGLLVFNITFWFYCYSITVLHFVPPFLIFWNKYLISLIFCINNQSI